MTSPSLARRTLGAVSDFLQLPAGGVATPATLLAGVRAGTATVAPIVVAYATGNPALVWTALGGWLSTFADVGGAYRARARAMAAFAVGGGVSCFVAALAARAPWLAVASVAAWTIGGAMLRLYGDAATSVGSLLAITFVASLGTGTDVRGAAMRAVLFAAGCVWAMLLSLFVWPIRPWQPARRAIADCYEALAEYARGIRDTVTEAPRGGQPWHELALREHARIRQAIETARTTLGETRRARVGSSRRGEDLVVLLESAELLFETLVATAEAVETAARAATAPTTVPATAGAVPNDGAGVSVVSALRAAAGGVADALAALAGQIPVIGRWRRPPTLLAHTTDRAVLSLWEAVDASDSALAVQAAALLEHAATLVDTSAEAAASLVTGGDGPGRKPVAALPEDEARAPQPNAFAVLRANLSPDSLVVRHALRAGVVAALATWAGVALRLPHATWVTTTALIVLQPYAGLTRRRGVERLTWTVLGGIVAAVLAAVVRDRLLIAAVMFPLSVASIAVRATHYGLFTFFLTPVFVLLAEPATGNWGVAVVRILDTLLGGALALAATRFLWPSWEYRRLPSELGAMVDAIRGYFGAVEWRALGAPASTPRSLGAARRRVGLASNNVDAAIQRFVAEPPGRLRDVESLMTMLTFVRRCAGTLTLLALGAARSRRAAPEHDALAREIDAVLADLAEAVRAERPPAPLPPLVARHGRSRGDGAARDPRAARTTLEQPAAGVGLDRVARQVSVLHGAATRAFADAEVRGQDVVHR